MFSLFMVHPSNTFCVSKFLCLIHCGITSSISQDHSLLCLAIKTLIPLHTSLPTITHFLKAVVHETAWNCKIRPQGFFLNLIFCLLLCHLLYHNELGFYWQNSATFRQWPEWQLFKAWFCMCSCSVSPTFESGFASYFLWLYGTRVLKIK